MSIRLRLSLLYSAILALTLIVANIVLYTIQSQYSLNWLKQDLIISSESLIQSILSPYLNTRPPDGKDPGAANPNPNPASKPADPGSDLSNQFSFTENQTFQRQSQQEIVRVLSPGGEMISAPVGPSDIPLPLSAEGLAMLHQQRDWWQIAEVSGSQLLIYNRPVIFQERVIFILQMARSLTEREKSLQTLRYTLIAVTLAAILAAFGIGWLLSKEALRPIRRISETARDIGNSRDFTRRLVDPGTKDEVGEMALTFNAMLEQLEGAYQRMAHSLEMQRSFVADVSHELRTPLTTLRGNLGLLNRRSALSQEEQTDILKDMVEESDRLIRLVNDLLALARADAGRNLVKEPVDLSGVTEEVVRQARLLDPTGRIVVNIPQAVWAIGDRDALKQILLIVLDNALKHTQGEILLTVQKAGPNISLCVKDSGPGMTPEQVKYIFKRFYRGAPQTAAPGLGLGLPIAQKLVENLEGSLTITSDVKQGSLIRISLRQAQPVHSPSAR